MTIEGAVFFVILAKAGDLWAVDIVLLPPHTKMTLYYPEDDALLP